MCQDHQLRSFQDESKGNSKLYEKPIWVIGQNQKNNQSRWGRFLEFYFEDESGRFWEFIDFKLLCFPSQQKFRHMETGNHIWFSVPVGRRVCQSNGRAFDVFAMGMNKICFECMIHLFDFLWFLVMFQILRFSKIDSNKIFLIMKVYEIIEALFRTTTFCENH